MQKVYMSLNASKKEVIEDTRFLIKELTKMGFQPIVPKNDEFDRLPEISKLAEVCEKEEALKKADFMLVVGGDGTMLYHAKDAANAQLPMLGINMGKLGFMNELDPQSLPLLKKILEGDYWIDKRMMLDVIVRRNEKTVYTNTGLNDAVLFKGNITRVINVSLSSNGEHLTDYAGDGVIVSTPTGSTAYSLSAGGPVVEPSCENIIVTPVSPHILSTRAFVLSSDRLVMIEPSRFTNNYALLSVDGAPSFTLEENDRILIKRSELETQLIRISGRSFYERVNQKLSINPE